MRIDIIAPHSVRSRRPPTGVSIPSDRFLDLPAAHLYQTGRFQHRPVMIRSGQPRRGSPGRRPGGSGESRPAGRASRMAVSHSLLASSLQEKGPRASRAAEPYSSGR